MAQELSRKNISLLDTRTFISTICKSKPLLDIWPLKMGDGILTLVGCYSGGYVTYHFRRELKVRAYARLSCYLPVMGLVIVMTETIHSYCITRQFVARPSCTLCVDLQAALIQAGIGVAYPLLMAPVMTLYVADRLLTYPVPSLTRAPTELLKLWLRIVRKNPRSWFVASAVNAVTAFYLTHQKQTLVQEYMA